MIIMSPFTNGLHPFDHGSEFVFPRTTVTIRSHKIEAQESRPILNPAPKEMISDSVELCETEVCFLPIQYDWNEMYDFQIYAQCSHQKWISNPQDLPRSQSLETVPVCIVAQYFPHDNIVCIHLYDECMKSIEIRRLSQALVHFVMDRASLCSLTIEYQVVQFLPNTNI